MINPLDVAGAGDSLLALRNRTGKWTNDDADCNFGMLYDRSRR